MDLTSDGEVTILCDMQRSGNRFQGAERAKSDRLAQRLQLHHGFCSNRMV